MTLDHDNIVILSLDELIEKIEKLTASGQTQQAVDVYRMWTDETQSPLKYVALFNLGVLLTSLKQADLAKQSYEKALEQNPDLIPARLNLGNILEQSGKPEDALDQWRLALRTKAIDRPENTSLKVHALNNLGRLLEIQRQLKAAMEMLEKSLAIDSTQRDVILHLVHLAQKICRWPIYSPPKGVKMADMVKGTSPLAMLASSDDPAMQLAASKRFVEYKYMGDEPIPLVEPQQYHHKKIRIGYLSSDLSMHAVSLLTVELFEQHDRNKFEVFGFCWSREDGTAFRQRVINGFDHFIRIGEMTDEEAAKCIRSHEIDIAVDLHGVTSGARPMILSYRPAPVQATYLGFPGTTGLPWIDYVIADRYMIPEKEAQYYTEKPLYLPNCFQVSDSKRTVGSMPSRSDYGLPEDVFVYCSFNNNYKYTPEMYSAWMRILKRVPNSIFWLLADNEWAKENLCNAAKKYGIKLDRLIFAPRVTPADYLARYQIADLFLDTYPFNGGTTANDALFMGLPLLTLSGRTFASRYAGSLLTNLGVPELITESFTDYEEKAVRLANNPGEYLEIKNNLDKGRVSGPVFNTAQFVNDYEKALAEVVNNPCYDKVGQGSSRAVKLYINAYSQESLAQVTGGFLLLDNLDNPRPDWMEYWPIRNYLKNNQLDDGSLYGFFSPKFLSKTGLTCRDATKFISGCDENIDVVTFSPQPDMGAFFLNIYEQGDTFDPGFRSIAQDLFDSIGLDVDLNTMVMDSRQIVFSNFFVANSRFWNKWLEICEKIFEICEANNTQLAKDLCAGTSYGESVQRKVFIIERIASLMLASNEWHIKPYDTFKCAWSGTPLNNYKHEAVTSDALKFAYNELKHDEYLTAFSDLRNKLFHKNG